MLISILYCTEKDSIKCFRTSHSCNWGNCHFLMILKCGLISTFFRVIFFIMGYDDAFHVSLNMFSKANVYLIIKFKNPWVELEWRFHAIALSFTHGELTVTSGLHPFFNSCISYRKRLRADLVIEGNSQKKTSRITRDLQSVPVKLGSCREKCGSDKWFLQINR